MTGGVNWFLLFSLLLPAALFFSTEEKRRQTPRLLPQSAAVFCEKGHPRHAGFTLAVRPRLSFRPQTADILFQEPEVSAIRSGGTVVSFHSSLPVSITAEALQTHFRSPLRSQGSRGSQAATRLRNRMFPVKSFAGGFHFSKHRLRRFGEGVKTSDFASEPLAVVFNFNKNLKNFFSSFTLLCICI